MFGVKDAASEAAMVRLQKIVLGLCEPWGTGACQGSSGGSRCSGVGRHT